jgi:hypothetical protein
MLESLLRLLRRMDLIASVPSRVLSIDDVALRREHHYATLFVALGTYHPIGLCEGRESEVVAQRLRNHPGVGIIAPHPLQHHPIQRVVGGR